MRVIIVGAHGEAKELINRISTGWSVSVIDIDQENLRNFNPNRQIEKYQGHGTSTLGPRSTPNEPYWSWCRCSRAPGKSPMGVDDPWPAGRRKREAERL